MVWARLDDSFYDHPKVLMAGPEAVGLFCMALSYAARHLTDGVITTAVCERLVGAPKARELSAILHRVGLWNTTETGSVIHDFPTYNPSAKDVKAKRKREATRMRRARNVRANLPRSSREPAGSRPVPSRPEKIKQIPTPSTASRRAGFEVFWHAYPRKVGKANAEKAWNKLAPLVPCEADPLCQRHERIFRMLTEYRRSRDWQRDDGQFIPYPATWLNERRWEDELRITHPPRRVPARAQLSEPTTEGQVMITSLVADLVARRSQ